MTVRFLLIRAEGPRAKQLTDSITAQVDDLTAQLQRNGFNVFVRCVVGPVAARHMLNMRPVVERLPVCSECGSRDSFACAYEKCPRAAAQKPTP